MKKTSLCSPLKISASSITALDITAGSNIAFLDQSSYIWCCGSAANSLIITNSPAGYLPTNQSLPVANIAKQFVKFVSGSASCIATLDVSSFAWVFGNNNSGELGNNRVGSSYGIPQSVVGGKRWNSLSSGIDFFCGLDSSSYAWAWGGNLYGTLGDNTITNKSSPVSVVGNKQFIKLAVTGSTVCALDSSSYAWGWGAIPGDIERSISSPVSVVGDKQFIDVQIGTNTQVRGYSNIRQNFVFGIDSSSYLWAWGNNDCGQFGNNTKELTTSPILVLSNEWNNLQVCGNTVFATNKDKLYAWGDNTYSQYGNGSNISASVPTLIQNISFNLKKICCTELGTASKSMIALDTSSNVWTWGSNDSGALGTNNMLNYSVPIKPLFYPKSYAYWTPPSFKKLSFSSGQYNNNDSNMLLYLDTSSNLWYWGGLIQAWFNKPQQDAFSPVLVPFLDNLKIMDFEMGYTIGGENGPVAALDFSSYAWMWGTNTSGQLGINASGPRKSYPVSVVGDKQWIKVYPTYLITYGLDISSYIWAWGSNVTYGSLGDNTVLSKSSPVSVVGGRQAIKMAVTSSYTATGSDNAGNCCFLDSSSYAWAFGCGWRGILGDNLALNRSSPVSVVGGRQFINLGSTLCSFFALDASSYLWGWGNNGSTLGDGTLTHRSSPVSVIGNRQFIYIPANGFAHEAMVALNASSYAWTWGNNFLGVIGTNSVPSSSPVSVVNGHQFTEVIIRSNTMLGIKSYPNSEYVLWGASHGNSNSVNFHMTPIGQTAFSVPVLAQFNTYLTSPVIVTSKTNILGKT